MYKYKILWLDDDFLPLIEDPTPNEKKKNSTRRTFQRDVNKASKYGIAIDGVPDLLLFQDKMKNYTQYDAVVLDLMGLDPQRSDNYYVIADALKTIEGKLRAYIYSNNQNADIFDIPLKAIRDDGRCFDKGLGCRPLFNRIVSDLIDSRGHYEGHEECIQVLNHGYLKSELRPQMDDILKSYRLFIRKEEVSIPLNSMRKILENMLQSLVDRGDIKDGLNGFNERIKYLTELCEKRNNRIDYESPVFPYSNCRTEVKIMISFLARMTQEESHFMANKKQEPVYLLPGDTLHDFNRPIEECTYLAFFVVMKWFYGYSLSKEKTK